MPAPYQGTDFLCPRLRARLSWGEVRYQLAGGRCCSANRSHRDGSTSGEACCGAYMMGTIEERLKGVPTRLIILAACGFARSVEHLLTEQSSRDAIETAECSADGMATAEEVQEARAAAREAWVTTREGGAIGARAAAAAAVAGLAAIAAAEVEARAAEAGEAARAAVKAACEAAREITPSEAWTAADRVNDSILDCVLARRIQYPFPLHVQGLATTIYDKRDWSLMPILADALEEIGQVELAAHCRRPIHARGCHVLDSIMGKLEGDELDAVEYRLKGAPPRLVILAACGFARTVEHLLTDQRSREAIDVAERVADGLATKEEAETAAEVAGTAERIAEGERQAAEMSSTLAAKAAKAAGVETAAWAAARAAKEAERATAAKILGEAARAARWAAGTAAGEVEAVYSAAQAARWAAGDGKAKEGNESILDCLLAPRIQSPFPAHVKGLASQIYENRDWSLMPILANALAEMGLEDFAQHCRQPVHAKGCHVLDSIMGKLEGGQDGNR